MKAPKDPFRTVGYVAEVFEVGEETIRIWCRNGKFGDGAKKQGTRWKIRQSAVEAVARSMYGS